MGIKTRAAARTQTGGQERESAILQTMMRDNFAILILEGKKTSSASGYHARKEFILPAKPSNRAPADRRPRGRKGMYVVKGRDGVV
jgi:hypothetical protein